MRVLRKVCWPGVLVLVAPSEKVLVAAPQMVGHGAGAAPSSQQQIHFVCQIPHTLLFAKYQIHFCCQTTNTLWLPNSKYTFEFCLLGLVTSQYTNYWMISVIAIWAFVSIISMSQPRWQTYSNVQQKNCKNRHLLLPIREKL